MRYRDNIDGMLNQMSTPPVQNIINTIPSTEFEARILKEDEKAEDIYITKKTMFLDKYNKKLLIKETDGSISEEYEIVIPLDEKDKKILELENRLKEMEEHYEHSKLIKSDNIKSESNSNDNGNDDASTTTNG
jgi:hypothetical protein